MEHVPGEEYGGFKEVEVPAKDPADYEGTATTVPDYAAVDQFGHPDIDTSVVDMPPNRDGRGFPEPANGSEDDHHMLVVPVEGSSGAQNVGANGNAEKSALTHGPNDLSEETRTRLNDLADRIAASNGTTEPELPPEDPVSGEELAERVEAATDDVEAEASDLLAGAIGPPGGPPPEKPPTGGSDTPEEEGPEDGEETGEVTEEIEVRPHPVPRQRIPEQDGVVGTPAPRQRAPSDEGGLAFPEEHGAFMDRIRSEEPMDTALPEGRDMPVAGSRPEVPPDVEADASRTVDLVFETPPIPPTLLAEGEVRHLTEDGDVAQGAYDTQGDPTRPEELPVVDGGALLARRGGEGEPPLLTAPARDNVIVTMFSEDQDVGALARLGTDQLGHLGPVEALFDAEAAFSHPSTKVTIFADAERMDWHQGLVREWVDRISQRITDAGATVADIITDPAMLGTEISLSLADGQPRAHNRQGEQVYPPQDGES